ncbi:MAG: hypothetical protein ABS69_15025 [Nitrosomonadales bacterium SCN 54-20]|nr:MAG: hypothetical protein ABS69_15025 [Nitrosomonadales bacterium SCN 54-20]
MFFYLQGYHRWHRQAKGIAPEKTSALVSKSMIIKALQLQEHAGVNHDSLIRPGADKARFPGIRSG